MIRNILLLLVLFTLGFQSLSLLLSPKSTHVIQSYSHDALHFLGTPHTHDADDPEVILLGFSAEARHHVSQDISGTSPALLQQPMFKNGLVQSTPDVSCVQCLPEPYLHRVTPPPRA